MAAPSEQVITYFPIIGSIIGFFLYMVIFKVLSILLKFKNKTWKIAAFISFLFVVIGYLLGLTKFRFAQLVNLVILAFLIKYIYKESWGKSVLVIILMFVVTIIISFLMMALMALILASVISGVGGGIPSELGLLG